jgi:O-antigen ligase
MSNALSLKKISFLNIDFLSLWAALCIATLPWSEKFNTQVIIVFGVGLLVLTLFKKGKIVIKPKDFFVGAIVFIVALVWLLFTSNQDVGLKYIERSLSALIFPFLFSIIYNQYKLNINYILVLFMISCFLRYLFFLYDIIEFELIFIFDYWREILIQFNQLFKLHALHPSYFSMFLGFCSMICYDYFTKCKTIRKKTFWIITLLIFLVFNLSLASKMPIVATVLSIVFVASIQIIRRFNKRGVIKIGSILLFAFLLIGLFLKKVPNAISQDLNNYYKILKGEEIEDIYDYNQYGINSSLDTWEKTNRIHIWKSSVEIIRGNILIGVGTGDINHELNKKFRANNQEYLATKDTNSHNQILDYLIKYGVLGVFVISFAFSMFIIKAWKSNNQLYLMFLVLCFLCMLTENILNRQYGIVFFFFINSMFYFNKLSNSSALKKV